MKSLVRRLLNSFIIDTKSRGLQERLLAMEGAVDYLIEKIASIRCSSTCSKSQLHQDLFVLCETNFKSGGFFVEFGAADGIELSNTYLLEKEFDWSGILAEPAIVWHEQLKKNRGSAAIDKRCVWKESGEILRFNVTPQSELSTLESFTDSDFHSSNRSNGTIYNVETITLVDLLKYHNAPKTIDYLSIDTEGSEYEILNGFDFSLYDIRIITCEHNFTEDRSRIYDLLTRNGYVRKLEGLSKWDDWYVRI